MGLKETKVYSVHDFLQWEKNEELVISPKYQRKSVWNEQAKSYLIDTIIRGLPIPQVFIRQKIDTQLNTATREVIDGQQRLRAIIGFFNNDFAIMKKHNKNAGGKFYSDLDDDEKLEFLDYQIPVELIKSPDDNVIYDMFMRVNTNSIVLNKQELRNARYWGDLKVLAYNLSSKWRSFLTEYKVFRDKEIIRMIDVEFISRLLRVVIDGIKTDTASVLDKFYDNNESMNNTEVVEEKFDKAFEKIVELFQNNGFYTNLFNKPNYIFTLFSFFIEVDYGISDFERTYEPGTFEYARLYFILEELESKLTYDTENPLISEFLELHSRRTTNEKERTRRINMFINYIYHGRFDQ
ncbi:MULTISPECIES: DUF262 domain-containing protein [Lactococcus]|uniref:DUF262 domain-containing protein n=1 Tax=Lactococcus TaxID=1357 RepID=UPI002072C469|nr:MULTISPECIES: DUF262 domain-containing protein [Lactococcus]MCT0501966.1 DUF262 domain-containing protein [Lactococcus cremoris]